MKKKIIISSFIILGLITVYALSNNFSIDISKLSFVKNGKKENVINEFNKDYNLKYSVTEKNEKEKDELKKQARKTTYLLFGEINNKDESSEHFYNRKMEFYASRYNPKDKDQYSNVADFAIPDIFNQVVELGFTYSSFGEIRVEIALENAIVSVPLLNVKYKETNEKEPMKYDTIKSNYMVYYVYRKQDNEWRLWYLYGEDSKDVEQYVNSVESMETTKQMAVAPSYDSKISNAYNFDKLKALKQDKINEIYENNKNKVVYLNGIYNNYVVTHGNGFYITDGLLVTTWSFLEKTLINSQYFTASSNGEPIKIEGIVTINPNMDLAIIKTEKKDNISVKIGNYNDTKVEDPAIIMSTKYGTGAVVQTGIIVSVDSYIQTTIPLSETDAGSPLFNQNGEVIGINSAKSINTGISIAINSDALKEVQNLFNNIDYSSIKTISFDELKGKYYYVKYDDEIIYNSISKEKWEEYSKIGNIKDTIKMELVKASYKDGIVSLRYHNSISSIIETMQFASSFKKKLVYDGFKMISQSPSKIIYENNKYKVIIMEEFDYLIIVMVKI